jgi:hypothetical protein
MSLAPLKIASEHVEGMAVDGTWDIVLAEEAYLCEGHKIALRGRDKGKGANSQRVRQIAGQIIFGLEGASVVFPIRPQIPPCKVPASFK